MAARRSQPVAEDPDQMGLFDVARADTGERGAEGTRAKPRHLRAVDDPDTRIDRSVVDRVYPTADLANLWLPGVRMPTPETLVRYAVADQWIVGLTNLSPALPMSLTPVGVWLGSGASGSGPYPCRCRIGADRPRCRDLRTPPDASTRWVCECWGRLPGAADPPGCCRGSERNPALVDAPGAIDDPDDPRPMAEPGESGEPAPPPAPRGRGRVVAPLVLTIEADLPPEPTAGYVRRFDRASCTCPCPTPWDEQPKPPAGAHCVECHQDFSTRTAFAMHRGNPVAGPCLYPGIIRDAGTGRPLMAARPEGGFRIWGLARS